MNEETPFIAQDSADQPSMLMRWRKRLIIVFIIAVVGGGGYWFISQREDDMPEEDKEVLTSVTVKVFGQISQGETIDKVAVIESASRAPLVARIGGRVTRINAYLGDDVRSGQLVVEVDGQGAASPARAQAAAAGASLAAFDEIEKQALAASNQGIAAAQLGLDAIKSGKPLTAAQVSKAREQADLAVKTAQLAQDDLDNDQDKTDALAQAADLALQAAELAQDQATIAKKTANQGSSDGLNQAQAALHTANIANQKLIADLNSQKILLQGQAAAAREAVRLTNVLSPITGQVNRLSIQVGDYLRPGQEVGQVVGFEGAQVVIDVVTGVREKLSIGQDLNMTAQGQEFTGVIVRLADAPSATTALWQVDILIESTPEVVHPGDLAVIRLPVGAPSSSSFIPLDAVVVRQAGVVLFTVDEDETVSEHEVIVVGYTAGFIEGAVDLGPEARVVLSGQRTLKAGDRVQVGNES